MVVATETARIDSLFLSDGSRVILGPGSTLAIHPDFGGSSRELTLRGEAMFDVLHDEAHPFIIHVPGGIVEDLGTTFSVRTGADEATRVVVAEGSVNLRSESRTGAGEVVLLPGDRGILPREGAPTAEHGSTVDEDFAWTRGILSFRDASIAEVDSELTRWYGYHFRVADPDLADRRLTAAFEGESPPQIGEIIALALGGRLELQGDTIVILPTGLR
jgi:transmembrane sensor